MTDPVPSNGSLICTFADCPDHSIFFACGFDGETICKFGQPDRIYLFGKPALCKDLCNSRACPRGFQR
jgi:hypothetical protein